MASIDKPCTVVNAFNFKRDVQDRIGHITALTIGESALSADITLKQPTDDADVSVVGVFSHLHWDGGKAEPMQITCNISVTNKNSIAAMLHTTMQSVTIQWTFNIFEYDREAKVYFRCFHSNDASISGLIQTQGAERVIYLADEPNSEVQKPENYQLTFGIVPEDQQQDIHIAVSNTQNFVKPWGIARS